MEIPLLGGGNSYIFGIFIPKIGEDEPILTSIFFRWVGSTTNQIAMLVYWNLFFEYIFQWLKEMTFCLLGPKGLFILMEVSFRECFWIPFFRVNLYSN